MAFLAVVALVSADTGIPVSPARMSDQWRVVTHMCWEETDLDGHPISATEIKVACISAGVLTQLLVDAGYCLGGTENEWKPC